MNDSLYTFKDAGFDNQQATDCSLLLLIADDHFSFAITREQQLMAWGRRCALNELTEPHELADVLALNYQNVITGVQPDAFTLLPESLYQSALASDAARYLNVQAIDTVFAQPLDVHNRIVFKINETVTAAAAGFDLRKAIFGPAGFVKCIAVNQPSAYHLYININYRTFDVAYFRQGKLTLLNNFAHTDEDELIYYILFVAEQLKLDPATTTLIVSGDVSTGDSQFKKLASYFINIQLNSQQVMQLPPEVPAQQILALSALSLCASLVEA